jgi:hypothetical protein
LDPLARKLKRPGVRNSRSDVVTSSRLGLAGSGSCCRPGAG